MDEMKDFNAGLSQMGVGIRRAKAGYTAADEGFRLAHEGFAEADAGFIAALEALAVITKEQGTFDARFKELKETNHRVEQLLLEQATEVATLRQELRQLRERLDQ